MPVRRPIVLLAAVGAALLALAPARGAFPGTNGLIAFGCNSAEICVANPAGSNAHTLFTSGLDPVWSPGGGKIAFSDGGSIFTANADGSGKADFEDNASQPSWSSDATTLVFVDSNGQIAIKTSSTERELTSPPASPADPSVSPNGQTVVYDALTSGNFQLFKISTTPGDTPHQLTTDGVDHVNPTWSPDGSTILYETGTGLATISQNGGTPVAVVTGDAHDPSYSPDGSKIAYVSNTGSLYVADASGANATAIVAATANASTPDWGSAASSTSGPPPPVDTVNGPTNTSYPTITLTSGDSTPVVGHTIFGSTGTWTGTFPISYSYQWKRCDPADPVNGQCVAIAGATSSSYTPTPADFGMRLRIAVSATNTDGRHTQNSEVTAPAIALAPKNTTTPPITPGGTNRVDQTLTVATGTWTGSSPIAFTYSWRRCNPVGDPASCVAITGATASTYVPTAADIGSSLRVWITGTNLAGSDLSITNHTFPILDKLHFAPTIATAPVIGGTALPGRQLTANLGTFNGDAPLATTFHWYRCNANGADCHAIRGATRVTYFPTLDDVGYTLALYVFASNAYGKLVATSKPTDTVAAQPPHVRGRRIVGTRGGDYLAGGGHDDVIIGLAGNDTILGGAGDDLLEGGPGNDVITGGAGADRIVGGPGSDTIYANDGEKDVVDCGAGDDRAVVDSYDVVRNCEVVSLSATP